MSYILDALRKADAQRERDPARGIHAQTLRATMEEGGSRSAYRSWAWIAIAAAIASLAAVSWYVFRDKGASAPMPREAAVAQAVPPAVVQAPGLPPPPAAQVLPPPAPVLQPAAQPVPKPPRSAASMEPPRGMVSARAAALGARPAGSAPLAQAEAAPPGPPPLAPTGLPNPDGTAPGPGMQPAAPPPPVRQGAQAAPSAIPPAPPTAPVTGLPPDAPKLTITGGVYSTNRGQRMLIVNGQVFREGADLGSGVTLEEIRPKSVYLRFRGARYSAPMP